MAARYPSWAAPVLGGRGWGDVRADIRHQKIASRPVGRWLQLACAFVWSPSILPTVTYTSMYVRHAKSYSAKPPQLLGCNKCL